MRQTLRFLVALTLGAGALGCGSDAVTNSQTVAERLRGTWAEPFDIPGNAFSVVLSTTDTVVTGSGAYAGEAGPSGTVTVAGTVSDTTINFDVTYDTGKVMHFRGTLSGNAKLLGIWYSTPVGDPVDIELDKVS